MKTDSKPREQYYLQNFFQKPGGCENGRGLRIEPGQWYLP